MISCTFKEMKPGVSWGVVYLAFAFACGDGSNIDPDAVHQIAYIGPSVAGWHVVDAKKDLFAFRDETLNVAGPYTDYYAELEVEGRDGSSPDGTFLISLPRKTDEFDPALFPSALATPFGPFLSFVTTEGETWHMTGGDIVFGLETNAVQKPALRIEGSDIAVVTTCGAQKDDFKFSLLAQLIDEPRWSPGPTLDRERSLLGGAKSVSRRCDRAEFRLVREDLGEAEGLSDVLVFRVRCDPCVSNVSYREIVVEVPFVAGFRGVPVRAHVAEIALDGTAEYWWPPANEETQLEYLTVPERVGDRIEVNWDGMRFENEDSDNGLSDLLIRGVLGADCREGTCVYASP